MSKSLGYMKSSLSHLRRESKLDKIPETDWEVIEEAILNSTNAGEIREAFDLIPWVEIKGTPYFYFDYVSPNFYSTSSYADNC